MAKISPLEFIRQVRQETEKVTWPSGKETLVTMVMVVIMTTILSIFFLGIDQAFGHFVRYLLSFAR